MSSALRFVTTLALSLAFAALALADGDWTGKIVLLKGTKRVNLIGTDAAGKPVGLGKLTGIDYRVLKEKDGRLLVRQKGAEGWIAKDDVVVLEQAIAYFTGRLQAKDRDADIAYAYRARAHNLQGNVDLALKDYGDALRLSPNAAAYWSDRGVVLYDKKDYKQAIEHYDQAIRLDPKCAEAFNNRGNAWSSKMEYDKAVKDYDEAIRLDPNQAMIFNNRGNTWSSKKEYDKAVKDYDEAIRLDPKLTIAFNNRGIARYSKKECDKAIKDFDEAIRLDSKDSAALFIRSEAQMLMRRPESAKGFQRVLDLQGWKGDLAPYAVILGHVAARQMGGASSAKRFLNDSAGKLDEAWPYPAVKFLRGEIDEPALLALATDDDKRTEARCFLALDYALKGRRDAALAHFRWVREHGNPSSTEYTIALAELDRLDLPPKRFKP